MESLGVPLERATGARIHQGVRSWRFYKLLFSLARIPLSYTLPGNLETGRDGEREFSCVDEGAGTELVLALIFFFTH